MNLEIIIFGIILLILDVPFITFVMKPIYNNLNLGKETVVIYALCAYIVMTMSWLLIKKDIVTAALTGFITYGTYAFTLAAILPGYTLLNALTELFWGTFLFTIATFLTNKITT
jgi:hypothetical protein